MTPMATPALDPEPPEGGGAGDEVDVLLLGGGEEGGEEGGVPTVVLDDDSERCDGVCGLGGGGGLRSGSDAASDEAS